MTRGPADHDDATGYARLVRRAAARFRPAGRTPYHFARGKLGADPVFAALLRQGLLAHRTRVLDLGCGQGVLEVLLATLEDPRAASDWPAEWPRPPCGLRVHALDLRAKAVRAANVALDGLPAAARYRVETGDLRTMPVDPVDAVVILDVLHYLAHAEQERVIARCARALEPGGRLLLRVGDAARGWRFRWTLANDALITLVRGAWPRFATRSADQWAALLARHGFVVRTQPMSEGTSFANVLLVGERPPERGLSRTR